MMRMPIAGGTKLGPYEIAAPIGAGGMGEVYRARDTRLNRTVAIKVLPPHFAESADSLKRFETEARAVSGLNHPHICTLFDIGSQDRIHYIVMEYLEGETLRSRMQTGQVPSRKVIDWAVQIANALGAAHEKGVVHRDLKPENIFITREDRIKLLDFGLAQYAEAVPQAEVSMTPTRARLTEPGMILGTVGYMSPEQVRGQELDERSDLFSLGAVLYEMLTGKRAFQKETSAETMTAILKEDPPAPSSVSASVSPAMERIVQRCLEKRPELRFRTAQDLAFALEMSSGVTARIGVPAEAERVQKNRWPAMALIASTILVGAAAFFFFRSNSQTKIAAVPSFQQLTFNRGFIQSAHFAPDSTTIVYGGYFGGNPIQMYTTRTDGIGSRSLELPAADVLGISSKGDMAILLNRRYLGTWVTVGTLAKVGLGGGAPREILENVNDGDISQDGKNFCVVHEQGTLQRLEYPIGTVLYETRGYVSFPRISSDGKRVAFIDHPIYGDDRGYIGLVENGKVTRVSEDYTTLVGLAWAPSGEIWFSGSKENEDAGIWAVRPGSTPRIVLKAPIDLHLQQIDAQGNVLLCSGERRAEIAGIMTGDTAEHDLSWYGEEDLDGISADGSLIAASATGQGNSVNYSLYFRRAGSPVVVLGEGSGEAVSPDGKWVLATLPSQKQNQFILYPTGPGEKRIVSLGDIEVSASKGARMFGWSTDDRRIAFLGHIANGPLVAYFVDLPDGKPQAITSSETQSCLLSPDGKSALVIDIHGKAARYLLEGGQPQTVVGLQPADYPIQWHTDQSVFVWDRSFPATVYLVDLITGKRETWKKLSPLDPVGALYGRLFLTPDGQHYAYRYRRLLNRLYLAKGLFATQ